MEIAEGNKDDWATTISNLDRKTGATSTEMAFLEGIEMWDRAGMDSDRNQITVLVTDGIPSFR